MRVLDLTGPTTNDMWSYGAPLPPVRIEPVATLETVGWSGHHLNLHTLSGTYIETAAHVFPDRERMIDVDPARFVCKAWIAQLRDKDPLEQITADELANSVRDVDELGANALLVATGWDSRWNQQQYVLECPFFTNDAMDWVIERQVSLLGVDIPCVQDPRHDDGSLVRRFFGTDRLLLAPLVNLRQAGNGPFTLVALPLRIPEVCGTPCRAILIEGE